MKYLKKILLLGLTFITVVGLSIYKPNVDSALVVGKAAFDGNNILYIASFVFIYVLYSKVVEIKNKRLKIVSLLIASIISSFEVIGKSININQSLDYITYSKMSVFLTSLSFLAYSIFFMALLVVLYEKFSKINTNMTSENTEKKWKLFSDNKKSIVFCMLIIFTCYIPYLIHEWPSILFLDSISEMYTGTYCIKSMVNHHPILHILIVSGFVNWGRAINNYNLAIGMYSIIQMLFTAFTFSYSLYYMSKKGVKRAVRIIIMLVYCFYTPFAIYSVSMLKDVPFSIMVIWFTICVSEIVLNDEFLKKKRNIVTFILISILLILFKNNGIYIFALSAFLMLVFVKKVRKVMFLCLCFIVSLYFLYKGPIFKIFNITDGPIREALSIPCQQIARTLRDNDVSDEDKEKINKFLPADRLGDLYYPLISDNVKDTLNNEAVKDNKIEFAKVWLELFVKYPKSYIEAFLAGSYGYWYPEAEFWFVWGGYNYESYEFGQNVLNIDIHKDPIYTSKIVEFLKQLTTYRQIPVFGMLFSIGFLWTTIIIVMGYIIYVKEYKKLLIYIPVIVLWLTCIASPVWCEFRYAYGIFTTAPVLLVTTLIGKNIKGERNEKNSQKNIKQ